VFETVGLDLIRIWPARNTNFAFVIGRYQVTVAAFIVNRLGLKNRKRVGEV
jgi:hypothetical protein